MRTTVEIETSLLREAKQKAARTETTLSRLVSEALRAYLRGPDRGRKDRPFKLITAGRRGGRAPTQDQIDRVLDEDLIAGLGVPGAGHGQP